MAVQNSACKNLHDLLLCSCLSLVAHSHVNKFFSEDLSGTEVLAEEIIIWKLHSKSIGSFCAVLSCPDVWGSTNCQGGALTCIIHLLTNCGFDLLANNF